MHEEEKYLSELLQRYLQGNCSPAEEARVRRWYAALGSDEAFTLNEEEIPELQQRLWRRIHRRSALSSRKPAGGFPRKWLVYSSVTAAVLLLLFGFFFRGGETGRPETASSLSNASPSAYRGTYHKTNNSSSTMLVVLQDESMVWLKPSGSIHYQNFSNKRLREVTLEGEAFFEVAKDPERPFLVHSGNVVTRVTGTKFNIKAYKKDATVEVAVTEGTVEVSGRHQPNVKLSARQKAVYNSESREIHKLSSITSQLEPVAEISRELVFEFSDTPLRKVVDLLEKAYPVSIELENKAMADCPLTASLNNETLDIKLELICRSLGASFYKSPGKILIAGKGCAR